VIEPDDIDMLEKTFCEVSETEPAASQRSNCFTEVPRFEDNQTPCHFFQDIKLFDDSSSSDFKKSF
jgi:hypothetical protein